MNDIKELLNRAIPDTDPRAVIDPQPDLARGRSRLHRRRAGMLSGTAAGLAIAALVPLSGHAWTSTDNLASRSAAGHPSTTSQAMGSVALVSYTGQQPQGFTVARVPDGWRVQGGDPTYLTIAPDRVPDTVVTPSQSTARAQAHSPQVYDPKIHFNDPTWGWGKIVVQTSSADQTKFDNGTPQAVDGREGYLAVNAVSQTLTYKAENGNWVIITAPTTLGWNGAQLATFASGVTVLKTAQPGLG